MARDPLAISEGLLEGALSIEDHFPVAMTTNDEIIDLGDNLAFVESFANVTAIASSGELGIIDAGSVIYANQIHKVIRGWTPDPLNVAVYTHGHVDHCFGVPQFESEDGAPEPRVISHEAVPARFDRYKLTNGYNGFINMRQFQLAEPMFPNEFRYPNEVFRESLNVSVGDIEVELHHDKGETDDHTWAWLPGQKVLCTGDLFIWVSPNCGNPQKAQRYPREWAIALRKMEALEPEMLLPGHGLPIVGAANVKMVLSDMADLLESIVSQCLDLMNSGAKLDDLIHDVKPPDGLLDKPWMRPVYDDPEFIVHNVWRLYGGWFNGNPASLKPAPDAAVALELASLAGGASALAARATELANAGDLRLASHLAEFAALAAADDPEIHEVRSEVYKARVAEESSLMAKGIFRWAHHQSADLASDKSDGS